MAAPQTLELTALRMPATITPASSGKDVLAAIITLGQDTIGHLHAESRRLGVSRLAAVGRLRGTGRGVHFSTLIERLESVYPIRLESPFEDSHLVAGAAWDLSEIAGPSHTGALAKLRWSVGANDLPMHVHNHSDRFIIVHEGRGFFHVSDHSAESFDGSEVRSIPARERDVFIFTRGTVHTFSTLDCPMTLLSCQLPYLAFDDARQYRLPNHVWTARDNPEHSRPLVGCDPAWTVVAGLCGCEHGTGEQSPDRVKHLDAQRTDNR